MHMHVYGVDYETAKQSVYRQVLSQYTAEAMQLIESLTNKVKALPTIKAEKVVSLATETSIEASEEGMEVQHVVNA